MNSKIKQAIQCEICSKHFACNDGLRRHKYFKHDSFGYNCDKCNYAARSSLGLLKHKSYTHGIISKHKNQHLKDTKEFIFEKPPGSNQGAIAKLFDQILLYDFFKFILPIVLFQKVMFLSFIYGKTRINGYPTKIWEFLPFSMSTLWIVQPHLKSFNDFI